MSLLIYDPFCCDSADSEFLVIYNLVLCLSVGCWELVVLGVGVQMSKLLCDLAECNFQLVYLSEDVEVLIFIYLFAVSGGYVFVLCDSLLCKFLVTDDEVKSAALMVVDYPNVNALVVRDSAENLISIVRHVVHDDGRL